MNTQQILENIREANLSYLMLAQALLRQDRDEAMYRLGLSEEVAQVVENLTAGQILKIAASNLLMCRFRFDDEVVWDLLLSHADNKDASGIHSAILMASRVVATA